MRAVRAAAQRETAAPAWRSLARLIDHTLLSPGATREQVVQLCKEAAKYGFATVCVQPCWVALAARQLSRSEVKVATVIGFPQGATLTAVKRFEALEAIKAGARELDMVLNVGALKSGDRKLVREDIRAVVQVAHGRGALVKVTIETALLTADEKKTACKLAVAAGADFVKTSTGFAAGGAAVEDVRLMRSLVGQRAGVKAAGGIRSAADAQVMIAAGASRIGASAGVKIVQELGAQ